MRLKRRTDPAPITSLADGLAAFASRHLPGWRMEPRGEPWHKLVLVLRGGIALEPGADARIFAGDTVVLVPAGRRHAIADQPGQSPALVGICSDQRRLEAACGDGWARVAERLAGGVRADPALRRAIIVLAGAILAGRARTPAAACQRWADLLAVLAQAAARPPTAPDGMRGGARRVEAVLAWAAQRLEEPHSVADLAARAGMAPRTFAGRVRARTGRGAMAHLRALRLARAADLIAAGVPVLDAALACGFGDLSGFYRRFRRQHGAPPQRWRRARS